MNLILWRHAEAEEQHAEGDLARELTPHGRKQATRVAKWLQPRLPKRFTVLASPAVRTCTTAEALESPYTIDPRLAPDADVADVLDACGWPDGPEGAGGTVVLVGHQPTLGRIANLLLAGHEAEWAVKKGALWWLSTREREDRLQVVLRAAIGPDLA